jgi:hypothetical protein
MVEGIGQLVEGDSAEGDHPEGDHPEAGPAEQRVRSRAPGIFLMALESRSIDSIALSLRRSPIRKRTQKKRTRKPESA